jgi:hypothetical protein
MKLFCENVNHLNKVDLFCNINFNVYVAEGTQSVLFRLAAHDGVNSTGTGTVRANCMTWHTLGKPSGGVTTRT